MELGAGAGASDGGGRAEDRGDGRGKVGAEAAAGRIDEGEVSF